MLRAVTLAGLAATAGALAVAQEVDVKPAADGDGLWFSDKFLANLEAMKTPRIPDAPERRSSGNGMTERPLDVVTSSGTWRGTYNGPTVQHLGVKFGEIPGRFERSHLAPFVAGVRNATQSGPACPQAPLNGILPGSTYQLLDQSEDCLSLDIVANRFKLSGNAPLPVVIRGSGDTPSTGATQIDDLSGLVIDADVITVQMNFRTSFTATPVLPGFENSMANNHWYDQQVAIEWVKANIANFGGNPNKITFACPHSRGGADCIHHIATGSGTPQPQNIILEEPSSYRHYDLSLTHARTMEWASAAPRNCNQTNPTDVRACLKAVSLADLLDTSGLPPTFSPIRATLIPGTPFSKQPWEIIDSGNYNKDVKFMIGYPNATGTPYGLAIPIVLFQQYVPFTAMTFAQFQQYVFAYFAFRVEYGFAVALNVTATYGAIAQQPGQNFGTALSQAVQDSGYHCFTNWLMDRLDRDGVKVYGFVYEHDPDQPSNPFPELVDNPGYGPLTQLIYRSTVQGNFNYHAGLSNFENNELFRRGWFGNFVSSGNPREGWKQYDASGDKSINLIDDNAIFDTQMHPRSTDNAQLCAIWGELIPQDVPNVAA